MIYKQVNIPHLLHLAPSLPCVDQDNVAVLNLLARNIFDDFVRSDNSFTNVVVDSCA